MSSTAEMTTTNKPKGWFSRRHQTSEAHDNAVGTYKELHGPAARRQRSYNRGGTRPLAYRRQMAKQAAEQELALNAA